jgi:hypothetical protein
MTKSDNTVTLIENLIQSSSLIFTGTVERQSSSNVPSLSPHEKLVTIHVIRGLRVSHILSDIEGKIITVACISPETLIPGQKAVFFTNSWIHGRGIAAREVSHLDINEEDVVASTIARIPELHLKDRLLKSKLVVNAHITRISPGEIKSIERNAAFWDKAELQIKKVLIGQSQEPILVYFPTVDRPPWTRAPRFKEKQEGIFILHKPSHNATLSEAAISIHNFVALDPADFQLESELSKVEKIIEDINSGGKKP